MQRQHFALRALAFVACVAVVAFSGAASADPPSRVARLGYMTGAVSFSPAGENDWVQAAVNRPLTIGDRLWVDAGARAEVQVGGAMIRMNAGSGVAILNLDDRIAQLQLIQGTLNVRVRRLEPDQAFEIDTPNLAFTLREPGEYRIEVDPDGSSTTIVVRKGRGEAYGDEASYVIDARQAYRFTGTDLREYRQVDPRRADEFDRWATDRDRRYDNSVSARYVSQDVVGYQDLDDNGTWRVDATYGNVWIPSRVAAGWAPYRDGHWAWVDPWGWTWVDDAPWGFAVSHYGRWTNLRGTWGWVPGPVRTRAYYAPALVAFVGGSNFQLTISSGNVGGVAWFPLGPREVYRPAYPVSRGYFENVNRSNTVINTTVINNYYNNTNVTNVVYANRQVPGAIVAVPTTVFVQSQPVSRAAVRVARETVGSAPVAFVPAIAPTERSVRGAAAQGGKPPSHSFERPVVARTAPPSAPVGFAAQQQQLAAKPGQPLDDAARKQLKPAAVAPAPVVKVVQPERKAPPTVRLPATAPAVQPAEQRGKPESRGKDDARGQPAAPSQAPPQRAVQPQVAPPQAAPPQRSVQPQVVPPPAAQPPESRGKPESRGQPAAPSPAPPQRAVQPQVVPPPAAAPAPAAQPPESRGKPESRGQPAAPSPAPPQRAVQPQVVAAAGSGTGTGSAAAGGAWQARIARPARCSAAATRGAAPGRAASAGCAPAPAVQPPEPRGKPESRGQPAHRRRNARCSPRSSRRRPRRRNVRRHPRSCRLRLAPPQRAVQPPVVPPQPPPAPKVDPRGQDAKPAAAKPGDKGKDKDKDGEEQKRDEDSRKQKG